MFFLGGGTAGGIGDGGRKDATRQAAQNPHAVAGPSRCRLLHVQPYGVAHRLLQHPHPTCVLREIVPHSAIRDERHYEAH